MKEIWKPIPSLDGIYEASNFGRVKSNNFYNKKEPKILSEFNNGSGYLYFTISINNKRRNVYVHRVICEAFNLMCEGMSIVNHKNGIKNDNRAENLEWCNHSINMKHAYDNGFNHVGGKKVNAIKVIDTKTNMVFDCIRDAADYYGIKYGLMKEALNRNQVTHKNPIYARLKKIVK
jgi:hypothetical protein